MLNPLEERILQYIISQNTNTSVSVKFADISDEDTIEAIKSLADKGLVRNCSSLTGASAMILQSGKYYFEQQEKSMYGVYYDKIKLIEDYVAQLQALKKVKNTSVAASSEERGDITKVINEVTSAFRDEFPKDTLQSISFALGYMPENACISNYYNEIDVVIACLKKILADTKITATKGNGIQVINNVNQSQTQSQSIEITFSQVMNDVQNKGLSDEDLVKLTKLLTEFENERRNKNKTSLWEKAKNVLKYLFDKSVEIGIAVLPYMVGAIK